MQIDWQAFTPIAALVGGAFIGLAAAILILFNGRIAGVSGIVGSLLQKPSMDKREATSFVLGLIAAPLVWQLFTALPIINIDADFPMLITAGLLVGIGTRYGAGCTSGHSVCGLAKLSPRSLIATLCFMATGFISVFIIRHLL